MKCVFGRVCAPGCFGGCFGHVLAALLWPMFVLHSPILNPQSKALNAQKQQNSPYVLLRCLASNSRVADACFGKHEVWATWIESPQLSAGSIPIGQASEPARGALLPRPQTYSMLPLPASASEAHHAQPLRAACPEPGSEVFEGVWL